MEAYYSSGTAISESQVKDIGHALIKSKMCQPGSHPDSEHDTWFLRTEISTDGMFDACAGLYLWELLKEPGLQADHPTNAQRVAAILLGNEIGEDKVEKHIKRFIDQLVKVDNCGYEKVGKVLRLRATGEKYKGLPLDFLKLA